MIPDSAGATPAGIFFLADDYLYAAKLNSERGRHHGPTRLLCYHAAELFLKSFLRSHGLTVDLLRKMQHDLPEMFASALSFGLAVPRRTVRRAQVINHRNDYVRVRYMVVEENGALSSVQVLEFATDIRESVRLALYLDEYGNPNGPK